MKIQNILAIVGVIVILILVFGKSLFNIPGFSLITSFIGKIFTLIVPSINYIFQQIFSIFGPIGSYIYENLSLTLIMVLVTLLLSTGLMIYMTAFNGFKEFYESYNMSIQFLYLSVIVVSIIALLHIKEIKAGSNKFNIMFKTFSICLGIFALFIGYYYLTTEISILKYATKYGFPIFVGLGAVAIAYFLLKQAIDDSLFSEDNPDMPYIIRIVILIKHILLYIPCVIFDTFLAIHNSIKVTPHVVWTILLMELIVFILYFGGSFIVKFMRKTLIKDGTVLLNDPVHLDGKTDIGLFQNIGSQHNYGDGELDNEDKDYKYNFAVSGWFYLNSVNGEDKYTNILNYGDIPNIQYNPFIHKMKITAKLKDDEPKVIYVNNKLKLQKWNHLVVNYSHGTIDVFLNNELVATIKNDISKMNVNNVYVGDVNGLEGMVSNIMYFDNRLTLTNIYYLYNVFKNLNPPKV
jgi:hypothetical protein